MLHLEIDSWRLIRKNKNTKKIEKKTRKNAEREFMKRK